MGWGLSRRSSVGTNAALLLALCGCSADGAPVDSTMRVHPVSPADAGPSIDVEQQQADMLEAHNQTRAQVSPKADPPLPPMVWSEELAAGALAHAERCIFGTDPDRGPVGENVYVSSPIGATTGRAVVESWAAEQMHYDYETNECSDVCGHYRQIVWRDTTEVGCAMARCEGVEGFGDASAEVWVCRYREPGNYVGLSPY